MLDQHTVATFKKAFRFNAIQSLRGIGIECELPVVTARGEAVSLSLIQELFIYLGVHGFELEYDEYSELIVAAKRINTKSAKKFKNHIDTITTDTAYSTIEIVVAPHNNLHTIQEQLSELLSILITFFDEKNCLLLGYGIQPLTAPSRKLLMPKERYLFFEKLSTNRSIPKSEGADSSFLNLTASNQCHIDIDVQEAILALSLIHI